MNDDSMVIEFPDYAIETLRRGDWITITLGDLVCKVTPYSLEEEIKDEFDEKQVVFKPDIRGKNAKQMESEGDRRTGEAPNPKD